MAAAVAVVVADVVAVASVLVPVEAVLPLEPAVCAASVAPEACSNWLSTCWNCISRLESSLLSEAPEPEAALLAPLWVWLLPAVVEAVGDVAGGGAGPWEISGQAEAEPWVALF